MRCRVRGYSRLATNKATSAPFTEPLLSISPQAQVPPLVLPASRHSMNACASAPSTTPSPLTSPLSGHVVPITTTYARLPAQPFESVALTVKLDDWFVAGVPDRT